MEDFDMIMNGERAKYFPQELVGSCGNGSDVLYYCYLLELRPDFHYDVKFQDVVLAVHMKLDNDLETLNLDFDSNRGKLIVRMKYIGHSTLNSEQVALCRRFQNNVFRVLLDRNSDNIQKNMNRYSQSNDSYVFNYLVLPARRSHESVTLDWECITGVLYPKNFSLGEHSCRCSTRGYRHYYMQTKNGSVCRCMLENSLVHTPHNGMLYCIAGTVEGFDGNTFLELKDGEMVTYKQYFRRSHGIDLQFEQKTLLKAMHLFTVQNYLLSRTPSSKELSKRTCELPPELCSIIMSPISVSTFYSFSFLPSVMHRIESLLIAANLKSMHADHCTQNVVIPTLMVLEAITTKKCQEKIHLESLETLGDSFLKYAVSQKVFKTYQNQREGFLNDKREKIVSNPALCKLGCDRNITGFIRDEQFDPKTWIIPGTSADHILRKEMLASSKKVYVGGVRKITQKTVADVVEALIGAYLSAGGEMAALSFMAWLGIRVDLVHVPFTRNFAVIPELHVNVRDLESLLNYKFRDATLLVEALSHGSSMLPEMRGCYQRLEFLGDAVLDHLITLDLYKKYPGISPGLLTALRSASVNNDCYGQSAIKVGLYKYILYNSTELHRRIVRAVRSFEESPSVSTFGWESDIYFPKVLADVIESLAGAIFVDSGYKEIVLESMRPLLEPLVTVETLKLHPVFELTELCRRKHYSLENKPNKTQNGVVVSCTVEVEACGIVYSKTEPVADKNKKTAERIACKVVLKRLKEGMSDEPNGSLV